MKTIIKSTLYILLAILVFQSCQKEKDYTLKEYNPKGGITDADFTFSTNNYLDSTTEEVSLAFDVERLGGKTALFNLSVESVEPSSLANVFTLTLTEFSLTKNIDTLVVGNIDWSKVPVGEKVKITIGCKGNESTDINYNGASVTVEFVKLNSPVFELGNITLDGLLPIGETGILEKEYTLTLLDKPLEEDIDISLDLYPEGLVRGTDFEIDTLVHIAAGQTDGKVNLKVYGDQFSNGQHVEIYLESNKVPSGKALTLGAKNWIGFNIGKAGDDIWLDKTKTYYALMDQSFVGNQKVTVTIPMLSSPALQNIEMPLVLSEWMIFENTHFIIPDKVARIAKGEKSFKIDIIVQGAAFASGVSEKIWFEIHQSDVPAGQIINVDPDYWWTTIKVGRK